MSTETCQINVESVVRMSFELRVAGVLTDATTTSLVVREPDDTTTSPTVVHDSVGKYHGDYVVAASGQHFYRFEATGPAAGVHEGAFLARRSLVV